MRRFHRALGLILFATAVSLTASCGSNAPEALTQSGATLEGTITHNGRPVQFALVIVQSASGAGAPATGKAGPEGRYTVPNVPTGPVKVAVNTDAGQGDLKTAQMQGGMYSGPDGKKAKRVNLDYNQVPKKYHTPESSTLTTTIASGSNTFDIDVPTK